MRAKHAPLTTAWPAKSTAGPRVEAPPLASRTIYYMRGHYHTLGVLLVLLYATPAGADPPGDISGLYQRVATDLKRGQPLVVTVHVALCDNTIIWCGRGGFGNGDQPRRNLYWGGAAGFRAYFDHARGYRRVLLDNGDGEQILQRVVYRKRVRRPSAAWRRLGVRKPFDVLLVGLAYRGKRIDLATKQLVHQVARGGGATIKLPSGRTIATGGKGHIVGYAGHNHLMDVTDFRFPARSRKGHLGFFALSCRSAPYLARAMTSPQTHALLLSRTLMYPGAFTIDGLIQGLARAKPQRQVYLGGVKYYARFQRTSERRIRWAFTHDGQARYRRLFLRPAQ